MNATAIHSRQATHSALRVVPWLTPAKTLSLIVGSIIACQLGLLIVGSTQLRLPMRMAAYLIPVAMMLLIRPGRRKHPAFWFAGAAMAVLVFGLLNPNTAGVVPAIAAIALYAAVLSPLWWASGLGTDAKGFRSVLLVIWAFQSISALVGVLQVLYPGRFDFALSAVLQEMGPAYLSGLQLTVASGEVIFRPMGLTDTPGGAASAGLISFIIALGLLLTSRNPWLIFAAGASMLCGLFCIYLSQVRSILVMLAISAVAMVVILFIRDRTGRQALRVAVVGSVVVALATIWAFSVGGEAVVNRITTLFEDDPRTVYMRNRGGFLVYTIYFAIPEYPFGAGLGRWGMVNNYFGKYGDGAPPLWAEIQWTAWVYDGGIPLMVAYFAAILTCLIWTFRTACDGTLGTLATWCAVVFAYNLAALAVTFNYPLFIGQGGMEFWMLNAALFASVHRHRTLARKSIA